MLTFARGIPFPLRASLAPSIEPTKLVAGAIALIDYFKGWLNVLLIFVPITLGLHYVHSSPAMVFVAACLAIIPLAGLMGHSTEDLSERAGSGIGGLLNATFGNAAEMIIAFVALQKGLEPIVKASLTGSIIGNLLFVMGLSMLAGGMRYRTQKFDRTAAGMGVSMLVVAVIGLLVPATYHHLVGQHIPAGKIPSIETISLFISGLLLFNYVLGLVFSLKTHSHHYNPEHANAPAAFRPQAGDYVAGAPTRHEILDAGGPEAVHGPDHHAQKPLWMPITVLLLATLGVVFVSESLVAAIEPVMHKLGWTTLFVGAVIIAIVGNAAEHSTAVLMALRNKMDLAMQICIGSSIQIALFVTPVLVFVSLLIGKPMNLEFTTFEILAILAAVLVAWSTCSDGETNWFEGVQLLTLYAVLGVAFFFTADNGHSPEDQLYSGPTYDESSFFTEAPAPSSPPVSH
jgi:Ca2+:H+ antiporter